MVLIVRTGLVAVLLLVVTMSVLLSFEATTQDAAAITHAVEVALRDDLDLETVDSSR